MDIFTAGSADGPPPFSLSSFGASTFATAATATPHFVILGDKHGRLRVHDVFGNLVVEDVTRHTSAITAVHADARADVLASASQSCTIIATRITGDGTVPLPNAAPLLRTTVQSPAIHLRVDPHFGKPRAGNRVAWADSDGAVRSFAPGWLVDTRHELKPPGQPAARALEWVSHILAFASADSVRVFDMRTVTPVCVVAAPHARNVPVSPGLPSSSMQHIPSSPPPPLSPPSPPSPISDASVRGDEATEKINVDFEDIDRRHQEAVAAAASTPRAVFVPGAPPPPAVTSLDGSPPGGPLLARWTPSVSLFMQEEEHEGEHAIIMHVTWPLCARTLRIGRHRTEPQFAGRPREIEVTFRLERADLPATLPGALGAVTDGEFATEGLESTFPRPIEDLLLSPLLCTLPFGQGARVVLVGTAFHGLALHLVDSTGRSVRSMSLPHTALHKAEMLIIPGGDPLVLILTHSIEQAVDRSSFEPRESDTGEEDAHGGGQLTDSNVTLVGTLTVAEQVNWLLAHNRFSDALHIAQSAPGGSLRRAEVSVASIGDQFLEYISSQGDFERLAQVLPNTIASTSPEMGIRGREKVMESRKKRWEHWIEVFRKADKLAVVAPCIPTYEPRFDQETYDGILLELAEQYPIAVLEVLKTWPADVFNISSLARKVEQQLAIRRSNEMNDDADEKDALRESLLILYGLSGRHDETLNLLLKDRDPRVFEYIKSHHLYEAVRSRNTILGLFGIDENITTNLLIRAPETVLPPDAVVPILEDIANSRWTYLYLHNLFKLDTDRAPVYHNRLLTLYVEHVDQDGSGMLYNFLKTSTHYSLDNALSAMGGAKGTGKGVLAKERVHVLAAMGDTNSALDILLNESKDTSGAIEFASDHGDSILWERLIKHASTNADTLAALLDSPAGGKVDPVRLIPLLNSEMRIPKLRDRLHRILVDAALERALREDATAALRYDAEHLLDELDRSLTIGPM